jgi:hypothetical protein
MASARSSSIHCVFCQLCFRRLSILLRVAWNKVMCLPQAERRRAPPVRSGLYKVDHPASTRHVRSRGPAPRLQDPRTFAEVGCQVGRARYRLQLDVFIIVVIVVEDLVDEKLLMLLVLLLSQNSEEAFGQSLRRPGRSSNESGGRLHTGADKGRAQIAVDRVTCSLKSLLCGIVV